MHSGNVSRREFLKTSGSLALALTFLDLRPFTGSKAMAASPATPYQSIEDIYRGRWKWDKVTRGTHCVDCYPGNCAWNVYVKDGVVLREEQAANYPIVEVGVPDMNPRGCQKGASFSSVMYGPERIRYPLKRVGARGSGKWKRVSWDAALDEIAEAVVDAVETTGPESVILEMGPGNLGIFQATGVSKFAVLLGATALDVDGLIGDFNAGNYITFGKFHHVSSVDDWFHADLILIWHMNPIYTRIPSYHYISEARYKGTEVITIAPDFSPSAVHADLYMPVNPGTDAALALGACQVILAENLANLDFVREQTDLSILVRKDTGRYLRETDLKEGGREDQLFWLDETSGKVVPAPLATLDTGAVTPALAGTATVTLAGGESIEVEPVMPGLRRMLNAKYTPEQASAICGTKPELIRNLGRKAASKKTHLLLGWNAAKFYHGDLMERAQCLLLALTGNWGKPGTGTRGWNETADAKHIFWGRREATEKEGARVEKTLQELNKRIHDKDPTLSEEMVAIERERILGSVAGYSPPIFYWYNHAGYDKIWENKAWSDPDMKRPFSEYWNEAMEKGWWTGYTEPTKERVPQVLIGVAGSTIRRTRGGQTQLLGTLWPKIKLIVSVDPRMSETCRHSDIILPPAWFYERADFRFFTPSVTFNTFTDQAVPPLGDTKTEWEMFGTLCRKIGERAKARGLTEFRRKRELTRALLDTLPTPLRKAHELLGDNLFQKAVQLTLPGLSRALRQKGKYGDLYKEYTFGGQIKESDNDKALELFVADSVREGFFPKGTTLQTYRDKGIVRMTGLGKYDPVGLNVATDIKPDKTVNPLTWHTDKKIPYPTYSRRAQFYIDHPWFIEAGEALPVHKDNPAMGGNYPLEMLSGHQRWSVHSIWVVNKLLLRCHRGKPVLLVNPKDAEQRGIADDDLVRVWNDYNSFQVHIATAPSMRPGEVVIYHAWEPYQFPGGKSYDIAIPGMIKYLHLAGGYGHLNFWRWNWQPTQADRAVRVDMEKV